MLNVIWSVMTRDVSVNKLDDLRWDLEQPPDIPTNKGRLVTLAEMDPKASTAIGGE